MKKLRFIAILALLSSGCAKDEIQSWSSLETTRETRAVIVPAFDWENADWMPTPPNQSRIPSPWVGQGSLASLYGMEIINDRKKINGWELMYSTFDAEAPGPLVNPYFILYNKYRGTMRIFLYLTTQFVATSSYLQDGLSIASTHRTSMLNFMGQDIIDATKVSSEYQQIQPVPADGTAPLASNKWYMLEYDIAYDPNIESIPYDEIQLCWHLNYVDISDIKMFGTQIGTLNGTIGAATTEKGNVIKSLKETGSSAGKALITGIGTKIVSDNTIDEKTGENKLGLRNEYDAYYRGDFDYSDYLIINPEVQKIADVTIEQQKLVISGFSQWTSNEEFAWDNLDLSAKEGSTWDDYAFPHDLRFGVRFTIKVAPKDGSPASYILKTFLLKDRWKVITRYE